MNRNKAFNLCFTIAVTAGFILLGVFLFYPSYQRFLETLKDLYISSAYYFGRLCGENTPVPTVTEYSAVFGKNVFLPEDVHGFLLSVKEYLSLLFDGENFTGYLSAAGNAVFLFAKILCVALPCVFLLKQLFCVLYKRGNVKHDRDTIPLQIWKSVMKVTYLPAKRFLLSYAAYLKERPVIWKCWAAMWAFHLNLVSMATGAAAYFLYFAASFDVGGLYVQFRKLCIDLKILLRWFPWYVFLPVCLLLFARWRKNIALNRLRHFEARNCGFINELPIVSMAVGSMGKKKTTLITDMVLSQEVMFRQKALAILQQNDMKFPHFPWIAFEDELRACMEHGTVYNLASAKEWVKRKESRFLKHKNADLQLYGYDCKRYGYLYDDALKTSTLFNVLSTYAQAYFIYVLESSLIVANYSIRTDNLMLDNGNFPLWLTDFFPEKRRPCSRHAHILDFDVLRLGRKVSENNPKAGSFEFGVVAVTEIGKERGNMLELKELKKGAEDTNQKNDLFNSWLKMCRHSATVDNFPFIKVFTDEQRPESWGADARDLADIINIVSCGELRLALPFYTIEEMISEWVFDRFLRLYTDLRFRRGDNNLLVHILKSITARIWKRHIRIVNKYGYSVLKTEKERGTMDGKKERKKYYLMNGKIYAERFSTDCFSDYFNELAKKSRTGLRDYTEYAAEKATVDELKLQNSYFIRSLYGNDDSDSS